MGENSIFGRTAIFILLLIFAPVSHSYGETVPGEYDDMDKFAGNTCLWCHGQAEESRLSAPVEKWKESVHKRAGVSCADCHGGNPASFDLFEAMDPDAGFKGKPERKDIPDFCASCHSDSQKMDRYELPVDQLITYKNSKHGKLLYEAGDLNVPTCVSCHGSHEVLKVTDRQADVYYMNVPELCSSCHSNAEMMKKYGIPVNQYKKYKAGIHGQIHYGKMPDKKPEFAPVCISCHGKHAERSLAPADIPNICGKCHLIVVENFKKSPHYDALKNTGAPSCISCHDNHQNERPSVDMFVSSGKGGCLSCHEKGSMASSVGVSIETSIKNAFEKVNMSQDYIDEMEEGRVNTDELKLKFSDALTHVHINHSVTHALDLDLVKDHMSKTMSITGDIIAKYNEYKIELQNRFKVYIFAMIMIAVIIALILTKLYLIYKEDRQDDGKNR